MRAVDSQPHVEKSFPSSIKPFSPWAAVFVLGACGQPVPAARAPVSLPSHVGVAQTHPATESNTAELAAIARLQVRVELDGRLEVERVVEATSPDFADACTRLLRTRTFGSSGAATRVVFACDFQGNNVSGAFLQLPEAKPDAPAECMLEGVTFTSEAPTIPHPSVSVPPRAGDPVAAGASLRGHYPPQLRVQGVSGRTAIMVRVETDGTLAPLCVAKTSHEAFSIACFNHVRELRFEPARDSSNKAVAAVVTYTCNFEVVEPVTTLSPAIRGPTASSREGTPVHDGADSPTDPWAGCVASEASGTVRISRCGNTELRFMRADHYVGNAGVRFLLRTQGYGAAVKTQWLDVDHGRIPFATFSDAKGAKYVAAPRSDILVLCVSTESSLVAACEPRIRWVARHGLPQGHSFPELKLSFVGKALHVPVGCRLAGAERIACGKVQLDWRENGVKGDPWPGMENIYRAAGFAIEKTESTACSLAGIPGQGRVFHLRGRVSSTQVFGCAIERDGVASMASCIGSAPQAGAAFPTPCDQLFDAH